MCKDKAENFDFKTNAVVKKTSQTRIKTIS
jgi:hypothetical protein